MGFRPIDAYLSMKDMSAREIYADMNDTLRADCIGYPTVTKSLKEHGISKWMLDTDFGPKIEEENFIDEIILAVLEEWPFSSLHQIAKRMLIPMNRVRYDLINSLGYRSRVFHRFPNCSPRAKTNTYRDESRSSSSSPVSQAPCLEIHCYIGRSLFFKSF
jgi:hypothetical protein